MNKINPKLKNTLNTGGNGIWSGAEKLVKISRIEVHLWVDHHEKDILPDYGELRAR